MSLKLTDFLKKLSYYINVSSELQVGLMEFACLRRGEIDVKAFCQEYGLRYKQALDLISRLHRKGLIEKSGTGHYVLTEKGREVCKLLSSIRPPLSVKTVKLLLALGSRLGEKAPMRVLMKMIEGGRSEVIGSLRGLAEITWSGEEEIVELNEEGRRLFKELIATVGLGPNTSKILSVLTRSYNPSKALTRFIIIYFAVSALVVYEVFAAQLLGILSASIWITVTLLLAALLSLKK